MKFFRIVLACIVCCLLSRQAMNAQQNTAKMRVGLGRFASASELTLRAEPGARLLDGEGRECAAGSGPFVLTRVGNTVTARDSRGHTLGETAAGMFWRLQSDESATVLSIAATKGAAHRYRGELEIGGGGGRLHVVNEVSLEDYVRGVIGPEMGSRAPIEALKAQAVASRTFALSSLGRWTSDGYDLRDSTDSQVYSGVEAERPECDRAVRETSGLILTVGGRPIAAYFCADCGGITAPGDTPDECPHSVSDLDAHGPTDRPLPPTWTLPFTPEKLTTLLAHNAPVGMTLAQIAVVDTDVSGRARKLRLTWIPAQKLNKSGDTPPSDPDRVRPQTKGDLPSRSRRSERQAGQTNKEEGRKEEPLPPGATTRDMAANTLRSLFGADALRSTLFTVRRTAEGTFVIEGRGWGHGRGLCQVGAMALAAAPRSLDFRAILHRYYAGATLAPLRLTEENEEGDAPALPAAASPTPARHPRKP